MPPDMSILLVGSEEARERLFAVAHKPAPKTSPRSSKVPASNHAALLSLQRSVGNQVVTGLIQRKTLEYEGQTIKLDGTSAFQAYIDKVTGPNVGAAQISKLATAFLEAAEDPSEDPAEIDAAMVIAKKKVGNAKALLAKSGKGLTTAQQGAKNSWAQAQLAVTKMVIDRSKAEKAKAAEKVKSAEDAAAAKADAVQYWARIQAAGAGANPNVAAPLQWLIVNKFVTIESPHRAFLSRYERKGNDLLGQRDGLKFGLSAVLTVHDISNPGPPCVIHLHCSADGTINSAGIKYLSTERMGGDNVVMTNLHFLKYDHGMTGDTVEAKVGAFN
jgi:hypothetical protein